MVRCVDAGIGESLGQLATNGKERRGKEAQKNVAAQGEGVRVIKM